MFKFLANITGSKKHWMTALAVMLAAVISAPSSARADSEKLMELLENIVFNGSKHGPAEGFATYYASRFIGKRTSSGHRYHPEKLTAAHHSLPLGTVVRVVNPSTKQEVQVTVNDRCASKPFHFIDLSRAAAKKIGLWGKGKIKVVIIPLLEDSLQEPV